MAAATSATDTGCARPNAATVNNAVVISVMSPNITAHVAVSADAVATRGGVDTRRATHPAPLSATIAAGIATNKKSGNTGTRDSTAATFPVHCVAPEP